MKIDRNSLCTCGSGKKTKKCCLQKMREEERVRKRLIPKQDHFIMEYNPEVEEECDNALELLENGKIKRAREMAECLLLENPLNRMVQFLYGVLLIKEGKLSNAIPYFEKAVQIYPYFTEAYYNLGNLYLNVGRVSVGLKCLNKVVEIEGEQSQTGKLSKERIDDIAQTVSQSQGLSVDQWFTQLEMFDQAFSKLQDGKFEESIVLFKGVLSVDPNHVQSYGNMGIAQAQLGNRQAALECFDKALSIDPDYGPAITNRSSVLSIKEGERLRGITRDVHYYAEQFAHS